jgi:DNA-binding response OmpR family regulator
MSAEVSRPAVVLVAEDELDILELVRMILEEDGHEILAAADGEEALAMAAERPPDLYLLDVMMPRLDGIEVTKQLRAAEETKDVPIIMLSARTQEEAVARGRDAGANLYLIKPFEAEDLQRAVLGMLGTLTAPEQPAPVSDLHRAGPDPPRNVHREEPAPVPAAQREEYAPVPDDPPAEPALQLVNGGGEAPAHRGLVLVAVEDESVARLVSTRLESGGYEVAAAHDPEEAMQLATERTPDHCILDASMPDINGGPVTRIALTLSIQDLYRKVDEVLIAAARQSA